MRTIQDAAELLGNMATGANRAAPGGLVACAFREAHRALRLCVIATGGWRQIDSMEEFTDSISIDVCLEKINEVIADELTDAEFDDRSWERSTVDHEFVRVCAGRRVFLVQIERDADCDGERFFGRTFYLLRLEGTR